MQISTFQFQPGVFATVLLIFILIPLFISLGIWQLDRAQQKRNLASTMDSRRKLPPLKLAAGGINTDQIAFRTLSVSGHFMPSAQILIDNRKYHGQSGFHVITPLRVEGDGRYLLVNRGWVAAVNNRPPKITTPTNRITLTGEATIPSAPAIELAFDLHASNLWPFLTLKNYRTWSGLKIFPFMILQSADSPAGFVREWERPQPNVEMHIGYAIQWFAFALFSLLLWLKLSFRARQTLTSQEPA